MYHRVYHSDYDASTYIGHPQDKIHFYVDGYYWTGLSHTRM